MWRLFGNVAAGAPDSRPRWRSDRSPYAVKRSRQLSPAPSRSSVSVASSPSMSGIRRSMITTSGSAPLGERNRGRTVRRFADHADPRASGKCQARASPAHDLVVVGDETRDLVGHRRFTARIGSFLLSCRGPMVPLRPPPSSSGTVNAARALRGSAVSPPRRQLRVMTAWAGSSNRAQLARAASALWASLPASPRRTTSL